MLIMENGKYLLPLAAAATVGGLVVIGAQRFSRWLELRAISDAVELRRSKARIADLEARLKASELHATVSSDITPTVTPAVKKKPVRVYVDGCFDLMHYGHMNALRQARALGDVLIVGLNSDADIVKNKGSAPVMPEEERYVALLACKFVGEVIRDVPYELTEDWGNKLFTDYQVDFVVHGDDPCFTADGRDAYAYAKSIGKFKMFKRTEGVSTTDIVGRMLLMTREHHVPASVDDHHEFISHSLAAASAPIKTGSVEAGGSAAQRRRRGSSASLGRSSALAALSDELDTQRRKVGFLDVESSPRRSTSAAAGAISPTSSSHTANSMYQHASKFLPTARRITQFAEGKVPRPEDRVVYMCGGFDLFNAGHIAALQEARTFGDFLLVGIHDDATINGLRGHGLPVLNLYERALSLLGCKYVDEVIIGAPWAISQELITSMNISVVVKGSVSDVENAGGHEHLGWAWQADATSTMISDEYAVPRKLGILREIKSPRSITALDVIDRILQQRESFQRRFEKKSVSEAAYVQAKAYVQEQ